MTTPFMSNVKERNSTLQNYYLNVILVCPYTFSSIC